MAEGTLAVTTGVGGWGSPRSSEMAAEPPSGVKLPGKHDGDKDWDETCAFAAPEGVDCELSKDLAVHVISHGNATKGHHNVQASPA